MSEPITHDRICMWKGQHVEDLTKEELLEALLCVGRELEAVRTELAPLLKFKIHLLYEAY